MLDLSGFSGVNLDIAGAAAYKGGLNGSDAISGFEHYLLGSGDDTVTGGVGAESVDAGGGNDIVIGSVGNDSIVGGSGNDTLDYSGFSSDQQVNLTTGAAVNGGLNGSDDFSGFEALVLGSGNDQVVAAVGNFAITGGTGTDTIDYTAFSGVNLDIVGAAAFKGGANGSDAISGFDAYLLGSGDDTVTSGVGSESVSGGNGNNLFYGSNGTDQFSAGTGNDTLDFSGIGGNLTVTYTGTGAGTVTHGGGTTTFSGFETIIVNGAGSVQTGSSGNESLGGGGSNDNIDAGDGNDYVTASGGTDTLAGGLGTDTLDYSAISTGVVVNVGSGTGIHDGNTDQISGFETYLLGGGADSFKGNSSAESVDGGNGLDQLDGGDGNDTLNAGSGDDYLAGGLGNDMVFGDDGNDNIYGDAGNDTLNGGNNIDTLRYDYTSLSLTVDTTAGTVSNGTDTDSISNFEVYYLSTAADSFNGSNADETILGMQGNDSLLGGGGNDTFLVGSIDGTDTINGGTGNDTIKARMGGTSVIWGNFSNIEVLDGNGFANFRLKGTAGADNMDLSSAGITLTNVERIDAGDGADTVIGGTSNERIDGNTGNDRLSGGDGDDTFILRFNSGIDTINGGNGTDTILVESTGTNIDWTHVSGVEAVNGNGFANVKIVGTAGNDSFSMAGVTTTGVSMIDAGTGNDTVIGSDSADTIFAGAGQDVFTGGGGADVFQFTSASYSTRLAPDRITDFAQGSDLISLSGIDANIQAAATGDQAFSWIDTGAFTGVAGQLRYAQVGGDTVIYGDNNGDKVADVQIVLTGLYTLGAGDFAL